MGGAGLLALVLLAGTGAALLVGTERGARWAFAFAARYGVEVEEVRGRLLGPLHLRGLAYDGPDLGLHAERLDLSWRAAGLRARTFEVEALDAEGVVITLDDRPGPPGELGPLSLPLRLDLRSARVTDLQVVRSGRVVAGPLEVTVTAEARGSDLTLARAEVRGSVPGADVEGAVRGWIETAGDYPLELDVDWRAELTEGPSKLRHVAGRARLEGSVDDLHLTHTLSGPLESELEAHLRGLPGVPSWSARVVAPAIDILSLVPDAPLHRASLEGEASGEGRDGRFRLDFEADGPQVPDLAGLIEGELAGEILTLARWEARGSVGETRVAARGSGEVRTADASGELALEWTAEVEVPTFTLADLGIGSPGPRVAVSASASGDLASAEVHRLSVRPEVGGRIDARGTVALPTGAPEADRPHFRLEGDWEELAPPLPAGVPAVLSPSGRFTFSGTPADHAASLDALVRVEGAPQLVLRASAEGDGSAYRIDALALEGEGVRASAHGSLELAPVPTWDATLRLEEADLEALGPMLAEAPEVAAALGPDLRPAGRLEGELWSVGRLVDGGVDASLSLRHAAYEEGGRRVSADAEGRVAPGVVRLDRLEARYSDPDRVVEGRARGRLSRNAAAGTSLRIDALEILSGGNRLAVTGTVREEWDLAWEVDAPNLAAGAGLAGRAAGEGSFVGPRDRPRVRAELDARRIAAPGLAVDSAAVSLDVDLADRAPSRIRIAGSGQARDGPPVIARVQVDGRVRDHALELEVRTEEGEGGIFGAAGGLRLGEVGNAVWEGAAWAGVVDRVRLDVPALGGWDLEAPTTLRADAGSVLIDRFCLRSGAASSCLDAHWAREEGGRAAFELRGVALDRLEELLPPDLSLTGTASLAGAAELDAEGRAAGSVAASLAGGSVRYATAAGIDQVRTFEVAEAAVTLHPDGRLVGGLDLRLVEGGGVEGEWEAEPLPGGLDTRLSGRLAAELHDRGLLAALSDDLWASDGTLRASLRVAGTVGAPHLTGELDLEDGAVEAPELGIRVEDIRLSARERSADQWELTGGARSGRGTVAWTGQIALPRPQRPGSLAANVTGRDFQVANTGLARVEASPDLRLFASAERVEVTGSVTVPRAEITPGDMDGRIAPSPDVVVVSDEEDAPPGRSPLDDLHLRVRVVMGDSVRFDGFGVTGRVTGAVTVVSEPDRLMTGQGELRLVDGAYTAARQRLTIQHGRLIYSDRPLEDPGLDIRVVRQTPEVLAGMDVRGTGQEPEITIFSDPVMPEAEAMAYLLVGRPIRGTGMGDGDLMERVATSMGFAGGAALLERIGPSLGLAEARIERGERVSDTALVVGTQFTSRLFVSYGVGIFGGPQGALRLRYQLAEHWVLRTESGRELGADLLYSVER